MGTALTLPKQNVWENSQTISSEEFTPVSPAAQMLQGSWKVSCSLPFFQKLL